MTRITVWVASPSLYETFIHNTLPAWHRTMNGVNHLSELAAVGDVHFQIAVRTGCVEYPRQIGCGRKRCLAKHEKGANSI